MKGPFYNLMSREGSREDDFVSCTTSDLIDSANAELIKVLILGKPRSGKTTLAKALSEKLDLVRISPDLWLETIFAKVKEIEENPPDPTESEEEEDRVAAEAEAAAAEKAAEEEAKAEEDRLAAEAKAEEEKEGKGEDDAAKSGDEEQK